MGPVMIEVALNGPRASDPQTLAAQAIDCLDAGATIVHQHDRGTDPDTMAADGAEMYEAVLAQRPDAILYPTSAHGGDIEYRWRHHVELHRRGLIRMALADPGSVNLGRVGAREGEQASSFVYANSFADFAYKLERCRELRLTPNIAVFEPGWLQTVLAHDREGRLPAGSFVKLYFSGGRTGRGGYTFGLPATATAFGAYLEMLEGTSFNWAVAVLGGDCVQSGMAERALRAGGHIRVGHEDWAGDSPRPSNSELVREAALLCHSVGRPVATAAQAASMLALAPRGTGTIA
jgi:uncharacterized protein (DUF849 family)